VLIRKAEVQLQKLLKNEEVKDNDRDKVLRNFYQAMRPGCYIPASSLWIKLNLQFLRTV
jgi:hypothetical protein